MFRDVGAPARLTRLVAGESLLNDAAAIVLYTVLLGIIVSGRRPHIGDGAIEFVRSFIGGGLLGVVAGRAFLQAIPWTRDDRLAEGTLTVALAYLAFIAAEHLFHVSGVVAVLACRNDGQRASDGPASGPTTGPSSPTSGSRSPSGRIRSSSSWRRS